MLEEVSPTTIKSMFLLSSFLFEAPIDAWAKRYGEALRAKALPLVGEFQKFSASIFDQDITNYDLEKLELVVKTVKLAKAEGLKSQTIKWLTKQLEDHFSSETLTVFQIVQEDYIPVLKTYEKNKVKLKPIETYNNIVELNNAVDEISENITAIATEEEKDVFFKYGGWKIAMPHTTEASCDLANGETTWCTARKGDNSQNLFLSYTARHEVNSILFYVIKDGGNGKVNPKDKMSVGFVNGEPVLNGDYGGVSVDAENEGLTEESLQEVLGQQTADLFLQKMREKAKQHPVHPAKEELKAIANNFELFQQKVRSFKKQENRDDFLALVFNYPVQDIRIYRAVLNNSEIIPTHSKYTQVSFNHLIEAMINNPMVPEEILVQFAGLNYNEFHSTILEKDHLPTSVVTQLALNFLVGTRIILVTRFASQLTPDAIRSLSRVDNPGVINLMLKNIKDIPEDVFVYWGNHTDSSIRQLVANSLKTPPDVLRSLSNDDNDEVETLALKNPNIPNDIVLEALKGVSANEKPSELYYSLVTNNNIQYELFQRFGNSSIESWKSAVAKNHYIPEDIRLKLSKDPSEKIRQEIATNSTTPYNMMVALSYDPAPKVRMAVVWGLDPSNTTPGKLQFSNEQITAILVSLSNDPHERVKSEARSAFQTYFPDKYRNEGRITKKRLSLQQLLF